MGKSLICTLLIMLAMSFGGCAPVDLYRSHLLFQEGSYNSGVSITWLGTAGVLISDGQTGILIDPYVSRFSLSKVVLGAALRPDQDLIRQWVKRLGAANINAVIVSHSHFDHSLDAPYFAMETGAPLLGSESTLNIGRGAGLPETQLMVVQPGRVISVGNFSLNVIESRHGPALFGRVPYPGTIDHPLTPPRPARDYKLGITYAILIKHPCGTILHHGSAGFLPGMYAGIKADVVLLGIAGRGDTQAYLSEVPLKVKSRVVIPIHFDDFFKPLEEGLSFLYTGQFAEFCATSDKSSFAIKTAPLGRQVRILPLN